MASQPPTARRGAPQADAASGIESPTDTRFERAIGDRRWLGLGRSTRAKVLAAYMVLLAISAVVSTLAIRQVLAIQLESRIDDALEQEELELNRLVVEGRDPESGLPFSTLTSLFDVYFRRNVTSYEEAMLAYVEGEQYRSTLERFPVDQLPDEPLAEWEAFADRVSAKSEVMADRFDTALGEAWYRAVPVEIGDERGALVVTILPAAQRNEIEQLRTLSAGTILLALVVASALAWLALGRTLRPVEELTETARSISQSDLTARIDVRGSDEATEMARSFNAMLDRLETVFRSQREFVQAASHELRDPLTIARGHLELLGDDPVERAETMELVLDEIERMAKIVDDLQLLAESEQPDFIQAEPIDLAAFVRQLVAKAGALAIRRWENDGAPEVTVHADRFRLTEAVMNLANNAVRYTRTDETISIGASLDGEGWRLWVRDTGRGIAESDRTRIFERFSRGSSARRDYRGAGLGLAIVTAITESHGGRVELESGIEEGSTFTIHIPGAGERGTSWPES